MSLPLSQTKIYGFFEDDLPRSQFLQLQFSMSSLPIKEYWRNNSISADFMADYFATFFPSSLNAEGTDIKEEVKSAVSFIANELLENAIKFGDDTSDRPVTISLQLLHDKLVFVATNVSRDREAQAFEKYWELLLASNPETLYFQLLEQNVESDTKVSGIGFLTMINDYGASLGCKFERLADAPDLSVITIMVQVTVQN